MDSIEKKTVEPIITYHEEKIGKTLYRVTSVHKGEVDITKVLEDLIVRKIVQYENENLTPIEEEH